MFLSNAKQTWHRQMLNLSEEFMQHPDPASLITAYKILEKLRHSANVHPTIDKAAESRMGEIQIKLLEMQQHASLKLINSNVENRIKEAETYQIQIRSKL